MIGWSHKRDHCTIYRGDSRHLYMMDHTTFSKSCNIHVLPSKLEHLTHYKGNTFSSEDNIIIMLKSDMLQAINFLQTKFKIWHVTSNIMLKR